MNVYDYIESPHRATECGYKACYLTKVSTVLNRITSRRIVKNKLIDVMSFGLDESLRDNMVSLLLMTIMLIILVTLPLSCWLIALMLP